MKATIKIFRENRLILTGNLEGGLMSWKYLRILRLAINSTDFFRCEIQEDEEKGSNWVGALESMIKLWKDSGGDRNNWTVRQAEKLLAIKDRK